MTGPMTVGELEEALFSAFPRADAEGWDNPGLSVGDREAPVGKVAVDLDQSVQAVIAAAEAGCNVLVTHHPPFIKDGPSEFGPAGQQMTAGPGRMVYEAARRGVNVIAMHTNADRAIATRAKFAELMGCTCEGNFESIANPARDQHGSGFGAVLVPDWDVPVATVGLVARTCLSAFGGAPRVWGDAMRRVGRIAFLNGSWNDPGLFGTCVAAGIDCMVVGETRYHFCVDAQPQLSIVELGHDRSELPIVEVLAEALVASGVGADSIVRLGCSKGNWWTPDTKG